MKSRWFVVGLVVLGIALAVPRGVPEWRDGVAPSENWIATAQREIAEREYQASDHAKGLQAR